MLLKIKTSLYKGIMMVSDEQTVSSFEDVNKFIKQSMGLEGILKNDEEWSLIKPGRKILVCENIEQVYMPESPEDGEVPNFITIKKGDELQYSRTHSGYVFATMSCYVEGCSCENKPMPVILLPWQVTLPEFGMPK